MSCNHHAFYQPGCLACGLGAQQQLGNQQLYHQYLSALGAGGGGGNSFTTGSISIASESSISIASHPSENSPKSKLNMKLLLLE